LPHFSLNQYKLKVFDSKDEGDKRNRLVDVVLASAAAPTYFPPAKVGATYYVDGGLCCNNPSFRAVAKLSRERVELTRIYVLSISTGAVPITKAGWCREGDGHRKTKDGNTVGIAGEVAQNFLGSPRLDTGLHCIRKRHCPTPSQQKASWPVGTRHRLNPRDAYVE
jgi:hypothetical protein